MKICGAHIVRGSLAHIRSELINTYKVDSTRVDEAMPDAEGAWAFVQHATDNEYIDWTVVTIFLRSGINARSWVDEA